MIWDSRERSLCVGSSLSGRWNGKPLVEDCLTIDLAFIMRLGPIGEGQSGSGHVNWSVNGQTVAAIHFRVDLLRTENARLMLRFPVWQLNGEPKPIKQIIALTALPQPLGGMRWWMRCPVTGDRARTLHLPPGGDRFASRKALGLAYRVERLGPFDRQFERVFRAQRRLGGTQGLLAGLERPKGMWRQTFARHADRFQMLDLACADRIAALIESG